MHRVGVTALALMGKVHYVDPADPCRLLSPTCDTEPQRTVIAQLASATFGGDGSPVFFYIQATTALVLILAANTAFNGFPLLGSVLAKDRFLPRQLHTRGDKLVFSNGILLLAGFAVLLIIAFDADVTRLIQLYIIGVFTSFSIGQWGMVRHWNRLLRTEPESILPALTVDGGPVVTAGREFVARIARQEPTTEEPGLDDDRIDGLSELLVRTDTEAPKHRSISWLILPMDTPGLDVRPLQTILGSTEFSEVYFDDVRIPVANAPASARKRESGGRPSPTWRTSTPITSRMLFASTVAKCPPIAISSPKSAMVNCVSAVQPA